MTTTTYHEFKPKTEQERAKPWALDKCAICGNARAFVLHDDHWRGSKVYDQIVPTPTPATTQERQNQPDWQPTFSSWRHGGWYVDNLHYPSGAVGCVSRNYTDKKWRIVCDPRPFEEQPTFPNRKAAAFGERELIAQKVRASAPEAERKFNAIVTESASREEKHHAKLIISDTPTPATAQERDAWATDHGDECQCANCQIKRVPGATQEQRIATPWVYGTEIHAEVDGAPVKLDEIGSYLEQTLAEWLYDSYGWNIGEARRFACFIVKAVNSHEKLVAALRGLMSEYGHVEGCKRTTPPHAERPCRRTCEAARAALAEVQDA